MCWQNGSLTINFCFWAQGQHRVYFLKVIFNLLWAECERMQFVEVVGWLHFVGKVFGFNRDVVSFFRLKTEEIFHWIDRQHFSCYFLCVDLVWPLLMCQTGSRVLGESRHRREKDADTLFMCLCDNFKEKLDVWLWDWKMTYIRWKISNSIKRFSKKIKNKTYNKLLYYDFFVFFTEDQILQLTAATWSEYFLPTDPLLHGVL